MQIKKLRDENLLYKKVQYKSCIKANEFEYPVCTNAGIYCMLDQNILWPGLKANVMLMNLKLV